VAAPEVYEDLQRAELEAQRWAWTIGGSTIPSLEVELSRGVLVGDHMIRAIEHHAEDWPFSWLGTYWTIEGLPDPPAISFEGEDEARTWAMSPIAGAQPIAVISTPWSVRAVFAIQSSGAEEIAEAHLVKVVS
jgi:predicted dehydrogenase